MPLSRTSLSLAVALAIGGTAAIASSAPVQPSQSTPHTTAPGTPPVAPAGACSVPSEAKCLSVVKVNGEDIPYLETPCGIANREACRDAVKDKLEDYKATNAGSSAKPTVKMLQPSKSEMPKNLRDGKYKKFAPSSSRLTSDRTTLRTKYAKSDDLLAGYGGYDTAAAPPAARKETVLGVEALQYWRTPSWNTNALAVSGCKEYAYSRSFTAARFIDASSRCRGDKECVFDVAYFAGNGGIADRKLKDEAGNETARQLTLPTGLKPKNDMFVPSVERFVRANGRDAKLADTPAILALEAALKAGQKYYSIGTCQGSGCDDDRSFKDVWAYHKKMHFATISVSEAEAEEYARRLARFRSLLDQYRAAVANEAIPEQRAEQEFVLPIDMQSRDPFERYDLEKKYMEHRRDQYIQLKSRFGNQIFQKSRTDALHQIKLGAQPQQQGAREAAPATGLLAMPAPAQPTNNGTATQGPAPQVNSNCIRPDDDWGMETDFRGPISCRIGQFLRAEWARKEAGQLSCLDPANRRCDWTMEMFEQSVLIQMPTLDAQIADEQFCKAFKTPDTFETVNTWPGTSMDGFPNLARVDARLREMQRVVQEELKAVDQYLMGHKENDGGRILGKDWKGGDYAGDKESFGAGYDYDIGWRVQPATKSGGDVCELEGSVHGNMSFDAYLSGESFPIVSGAVQVRSKPRADGHAEFKAHLKMFDISLYPSKYATWTGTQTFGGSDTPGTSISVPDPKPRFDIMVGFVPVSGQVWGELMFGSGLEVGGTASTSCSTTQPKFGVKGAYIPVFMAFGNGKVGVGIAGLVSAGIRASLLLAMISTPIDFTLGIGSKNGIPAVTFGSDLRLMLGTLGGRVSLYLEFLLYEEEFELVRWKGLFSDVPLMKLAANVSFMGLK